MNVPASLHPEVEKFLNYLGVVEAIFLKKNFFMVSVNFGKTGFALPAPLVAKSVHPKGNYSKDENGEWSEKLNALRRTCLMGDY